MGRARFWVQMLPALYSLDVQIVVWVCTDSQFHFVVAETKQRSCVAFGTESGNSLSPSSPATQMYQDSHSC